MNSKAFYDSIRATLFAGKISGKQFEGMEAILSEYSNRCINDLRKLAYVLATAYHETAKTMQPIAEYGKGRGYDYGKKLKMSRQPYSTPNHIYYGRGHIQLTWYENYYSMGKKMGIDLLNNPDLMLTMSVSISAMFTGMINGMFTGKRLGDYFTADKTDPVNARKIVNGLDAAGKIKGYYELFYGALTMQ